MATKEIFSAALKATAKSPTLSGGSACLNQGLNRISNSTFGLYLKNQSRPFVVAVEGNIGSGKSTMLDYYEKSSDVDTVPEPLEKWCNVQGNNLLALMYEDPKRWSFLFQSYIQCSRLDLLTQPIVKPIRMLERSPQSNCASPRSEQTPLLITDITVPLVYCRNCFVQNAYRNGNLTNVEYEVLSECYSWFEKNVNMHLDLIVYLRTTPEVSYQRLLKRNRPEERNIPLSYIENLHDAYERWLGNEQSVPVIVLDANKPIHEMHQLFEEHRDRVTGVVSS